MKSQPHTGVLDLLQTIARNEVALELIRQRLVRECEDFNTVDAFRMLDKRAQCEVNKKELVEILVQEVRVQADTKSLDILIDGSLKYSQFCELFVPKSQKVLGELTAKKPKNLQGRIGYFECFDQLARELYAQAWDQILDSSLIENRLKADLMRDPSFDIGEAFRHLTHNKEITRDDLISSLGQHLD